MKKQLIVAIALLTLSIVNTNAQGVTPEKLGFKAFSLVDHSLGDIHYYVTSNSIDSTKPVLLYLDGSGPYPLFQYTERGIGSSVAIDYKNLSNQFHIVLISKPGVPFIDSVKMDKTRGIPVYQAPTTYNEKLSLDWRVNAASLVLKKVINELKVDTGKVSALGISEGFQVGAKLAAVNKSVTHLALLVGNGLNQLFDFVIQNRINEQSGNLTKEASQKNIDSLMSVAKAIYADPNAIDKEWFGHTYLRWSSFTNSNPTENILSLDIPVYLVAASNDRNTAVLGTDYLYLESIRRGKHNIEYKVYPYDHSLNETIKDESGKTVSVKSHLREILGEAIGWINRH